MPRSIKPSFWKYTRSWSTKRTDRTTGPSVSDHFCQWFICIFRICAQLRKTVKKAPGNFVYTPLRSLKFHYNSSSETCTRKYQLTQNKKSYPRRVMMLDWVPSVAMFIAVPMGGWPRGAVLLFQTRLEVTN
jgi:hypothetical protein